MEKTKKNIEMNLRIGNKIKRIIKYETCMETEGDAIGLSFWFFPLHNRPKGFLCFFSFSGIFF
jgi:hypothetical protein